MMPSVNKGEESELYLKSFLLREKTQNRKDTIFGKIMQLSDNGNLSELVWDEDADKYLENKNVGKLKSILGIRKSGTNSKTDVTINNTNYSVKEIDSQPPAIINHTTREKFERVCEKLNDYSIDQMDEIISEYWGLRLSNGTEDVHNDKNSPFFKHKNYFKPIINYFLFDGTGTRRSDHPADKILEIKYMNLPDSMRVYNKDEYYDVIWPSLIFSLRNKSMPKNYPNCKNSDSIKIWTKFAEAKPKGAFHIRVKKPKIMN